MTTLDDKLLGEKTHYYCSSSEDEGNDDDSDDLSHAKEPQPKFIPSQNLDKWEGSSTNTGPKGVIKDWQRYKQLETERREEQEQEKLALMKKMSLTCQSAKDEENEKQQHEDVDAELRELLDDKILEEFKQMHMLQMMEQHGGQSKYGSVFEIKTGEEYLDAVDRADKTTTVVIYIYNNGDKSCKLMYECFHELAAEYPEVKFCCVEVTVAGLSRHFERRGVPAILIYKNGGLMGNFIRVTDELGDEFVTSDIENYLLEHGMLPDHSLIFSSLRKAQNAEQSDSE
ncbi:phosducin-like protein isoform X2 [Parasteatoda tepidariorum]|uniref:phosducin-like protein isoform X2 n=1 Tax=Parasteatoda tepidariorum TaxID=114398 RepID=UPI00077F849B|nr:phosducin-like protein isoform X2 [Parasteatoda tepidariorum]XP_015903548.1 phosducin-like protein isoform X2 [Parasteatoda tepidariorum]